MRNPNGYGSVVKLSGNRRKPYHVRKTKGWSDKGYPIYATIGFTKTREEGLIMLAEYNKNPYDIDLRKNTVKEIYEKWYAREQSKLGASLIRTLRAAWKYCTPIYKMEYRSLRAYQMQECIDNCDKSYATKSNIRNLFYHLDKFAFELDVIDKSYSVLLTTPEKPEVKKTPFTADEINKLWEMKDIEWVDSVLAFLYTGFRINELLSLKKSAVDIENRTLTGGNKSKAGRNRLIPIHPRINELIMKRYNTPGSERLFAFNGRACTSTKYYDLWKEIMIQIGAEHTPHECRHTFRSLLDSAGGNKVSIDLLMGHKSKDVGERVYTHKTIEELRATIRLLK